MTEPIIMAIGYGTLFFASSYFVALAAFVGSLTAMRASIDSPHEVITATFLTAFALALWVAAFLWWLI